MNRYTLAAAITVYITAVVLANALTTHYGLVSAGFGLMVTAGTYAAGAALLARDFVHRHATGVLGNNTGTLVVIASIAAAALVSLLTGTGSDRIVLASTIAFLTAEIIDLLVFIPLRERRGFGAAALGSNIVSAPVDTFVFLWIAGFAVTAEAVTGQLVAKLLWATVIPLTVWAIWNYRATRGTREYAASR